MTGSRENKQESPSFDAFPSLLLAFYDQQGRHHLPWRQHKGNAYAVWLSEMMLQQTTVQTVIPYYMRFLEAFPTRTRQEHSARQAKHKNPFFQTPASCSLKLFSLTNQGDLCIT